jgi:outer membrane protein assembly factor BamB
MAVTDRVESAWPLPGATLVHDGTLYCLAGRITGADGGMPMHALDPMTGVVKWRRVVGRTTNPKLATGGDPKLYYWIEPEGQLSNNHLLGDGNVIRLPDQHFVWDFRATDGEQIVPDAVQGVRLSTFTSHFPWLGYDRPTWSYTFQGFDIHAEYRHPYESGTMMAYAGTNEVGIVCKRLRKEQVTELIPTRVDDAQKNWEDKTRGELPWKPLRLDTDVHALVIAGTDAFIGGMDFALNPVKGRLIVLALKNGAETQRIELPALPTYDGVAVARGKVYVSLQDGTLLCFAGQR